MPTPNDVAEAKLAAQQAIFKRIESIASGTPDTSMLLKISLAYRYAAGGAQPGGGEQLVTK